MQNESTMEQSLESVDDEDLGQEIERLSKELEQIQSGRELSKLTKEEAGTVLELMKQIEERQEKQRLDQQEKEQIWTYEMFVNWARDEVGRMDSEEWLKKKFDLSNLQYPKFRRGRLVLSEDSRIKRIPPGLQVETADFCNAKVQFIPENVNIEYLYLNSCPIKTFPSNLHVGTLSLVNTQVEEVQGGFKCEVLDIRQCNITKVSREINISELFITKARLSSELIQQLEEMEGNQIKKIDWE
ncbi:hypothetical protein HN958_03495 [Candidatus Falkowbacteria bacterium]|jgi:hypothetical protein|nr:hypothetical protein [Candidatus Falkowbacteria bacterium]MBT7007542.1 hypothetical protein [Candidatus Falkowbacteria bacterium]